MKDDTDAPNNRSVVVSRDASGTIIIAGDHNSVVVNIKIDDEGLLKTIAVLREANATVRVGAFVAPASSQTPILDSGSILSDQQKSEIRKSYLQWLERQLEYLPAHVTINEQRVDIPIDRVFVSLRGCPGSTSEISQAITLRVREDRYEEPSIWQERDLPGDFTDNRPEAVDLAAAFTRHRTMVILGDPGSGKTTTARWLALAFARACRSEEADVLVPEKAVDSNSPRPNHKINLGTARLPIYLRIAELAKEYRRRNKLAVLADMLGYGESLDGTPVYLTGGDRQGERIDPEHLTLLFKDALRNQRAVVFLDGLDEIVNPEDRGDIVKLLHGFLDSFFAENLEPGHSNQLLVTSRIIGYELLHLRDSVSRYTIERLSEPAMAEFIDCWHAACARKLAHKGLSPEEASRHAGTAFKDQIFNPEREALRELASNPFMLSLLCVLNQEHNQKLPSSRANLYEMLVDRGLRALFLEKREAHRKLGELVDRILMLLANRMHTTTSNGLLPHKEIEEIIWNAVGQDRVGAQAIESREEAFRLVVGSVGLLDERGVGEYCFKHQTIQEFLAGKLLVQQEHAAAGNLINKTNDPRWREAVLLGLGFLCHSLPEERATAICRELAAAKAGVVPVGAVLLAQVMREFAPVPLGIVYTTVQILLTSYKELVSLQGNARFSAFVELFVGDLLVKPAFSKSWRSVTERACLDFAETGGKEGHHALAKLLYARRLAVPFMASTLLSALHFDGEDGNWVVNRTLEMMATSEARRLAAAQPVTAAICRQLTPKTLATLRDPNVFEAIRYTPRSRAPLQQQETGIAVHLLPFREALEEMHEAIDFIQADVRWLRLVTALYGGLGSFEANDLGDALQEGKITIISAVNGVSDAAHIARFLDTDVQPAWERLKSQPPALNIKWMYRDSPLTPLLVRWLSEKVPLGEAVPKLREIWKSPDLIDHRSLAWLFVETSAGSRLTGEEATEVLLADALLALLACSALDRDVLLSPPSPLHERALRRFTAQMRRILMTSRDPLLRVRGSLEKVFEICASVGDVEAENDAMGADSGTEVSDQIQLSSNTEEAADQLSGLWANLVRLGSPGHAHRTAVLLDCSGKLLCENPEALFRSWAWFLGPGRRSWAHPREAEIACLAIAADDPDVFLTRCIGGIDCLPAEFESLKAFALSRAARLFEKHSQLKMLAVSLALTLPTPLHRKTALEGLFSDGVVPDEASLRKEILKQAASAVPEHAIVPFRALRYAGSANREEWRRALLDCALRVQPVCVRAAALMQTAIVLKFFAEGELARKALTSLLPQLRDTADCLSVETFLHSDSPAAPSAFLETWQEVSGFLEELRVDTPTPLGFISAQDSERHHAFVAQYFRSLFLNLSDDREYSIAVVLDTAGKKLDLPPGQLMLALASSLRLALDLRWDACGLLPAFSLGASGRNKYLDALLFIAVVPQRYDFFAAWALSRIGGFASRAAPEWMPLLTVVSTRIGDAYQPLAMADLGERWRAISPEERTAELRREALTIDDPFVRFHTLRFFRKTGTAVPFSAVLDAADKIRDARERMLALSDCVIELANEFLVEGTEQPLKAAIGRCDPESREALLSLVSVIAPHHELLPKEWTAEQSPTAALGPRFFTGPAVPQENRAITRSQLEIESGAMRWLAARAPHVTGPQNQAALTLILNGLAARQLLAVLPSPDSASEWDLLADPSRRTRALAALAVQGLKEYLLFDDHAMKAIQEWIARGESFTPLEPVLPLVFGGPQTAAPQLEEWFVRYPSQILGQWAGVMLAEQERWSGAVVDRLIGLLRHNNDLLRNRAAIAIMMTGRTGGFAQSSAMGEEAVLALAKASIKVTGVSSRDSHAFPDSVLTPIRWAFEQIVIDTPGLLTRLRDEYVNGGIQVAPALYRRLNYVSPAVRKEIAALLWGTLPVKLRASLIHGLIALWERSWHRVKDDDPVLKEIRSHLWEKLDDDDQEIRIVSSMSLGFMGGQHDIQRLADLVLSFSSRKAEHIRMLAVNTMSPASYAKTILNQGSILYQTLLDLLGGKDNAESVAAGELLLRMGASPEEVRARMRDDGTFLDSCFFSAAFYFIGDPYNAQLRRVARGIERITSKQTEIHGVDGTDIFTMALRRAHELMASGKWHYSDLHKSSDICEVLPVCAAAAELMPDLYRRIVENFLPGSFLEKLELAVSKGEAFTLREAGLVLLALLRNFSKNMGGALIAASADAFHVQHVAIRQISRLREVDPFAITKLEDLLKSPSANICYVATRIVVSALQNQNLPVEHRRLLHERASAALLQAAQRVGPNQVISLLESGDDIFKPRIRNVGFLKDVLTSALLGLSSVYLDSGVPEQSAAETARVRVKTDAAGERQTFELWLGEHAANGVFPNQREWIEKVLRLQIPQEVTDTLNDVQQVAGAAGVSCAALADAAQRLD